MSGIFTNLIKIRPNRKFQQPEITHLPKEIASDIIQFFNIFEQYTHFLSMNNELTPDTSGLFNALPIMTNRDKQKLEQQIFRVYNANAKIYIYSITFLNARLLEVGYRTQKKIAKIAGGKREKIVDYSRLEQKYGNISNKRLQEMESYQKVADTFYSNLIKSFVTIVESCLPSNIKKFLSPANK